MLEAVLMRAYVMLYASGYESAEGHLRQYKSGRSSNSERRAFTLLSSVCCEWYHTLVGWPESSTRLWVRHQLQKLIEREYTVRVRKFYPLKFFFKLYFSKAGNFKATCYTHVRHIYAKLQSLIQLCSASTKLCRIKRDHLENFYISLEGPLYQLHSLQSMNGHQIYQTSIHLTIMCGVQCCRHFTNLI